MFIKPVGFTQEAACPVAGHRVADLATGHDAKDASLPRHFQQVEHSQPSFDAAPMLVDLSKLGIPLKALAFLELMSSMQRLYRREALASFAATPTKSGTAAFGARALQEAEAALATAFRRLIRTFHSFGSFRKGRILTVG